MPHAAKRPYTDLTSVAAVEGLMSQGGGAGVIDIWAPWCAPCRATAPHFEAVARQYQAHAPAVGFYKLDTESQPHLAAAFNIQSIPTMLFVLDGEILDVIVGAVDAKRLAAKVEWLLSKARGDSLWSRLTGRKRTPPPAEPAR